MFFFTIKKILRRFAQMAKNSDTRFRLLSVIGLLYYNTDQMHPMSLKMIEDSISSYDFSVGRRGILGDIIAIQRINPDYIGIIKKGNENYYYWNKRAVSLPELKVLTEAVQSSRVLTKIQSLELIQKLKNLVSVHEGSELQSQVHIIGRTKAENENVLSNVDTIHRSIMDGRKIRFHYTQWGTDKELAEKRNGEWYCFSPYYLVMDQEKLYLVTYSSNDKKDKTFRVDKMKDVEILQEIRDGQQFMEKYDLAKCTNRYFGMFSGRPAVVKLSFSQELIGVALDRFGKDINIRVNNDNSISFSVEVSASNQFYGFIFGLGPGATIISPEWVVEEYKSLLLENYFKYY